jgi:flagellar protein FliO/FliZ
LLLAVGFLLFIPTISAQETTQERYADSGELAVAVQLADDVDPLLAAEQALFFDDGAAVGMQGTGPSVWAVVRMVLVLALAAIAIYGVVFFLKRTSRQTPSSDPFLKILANSHIGFNRYVHIVSVGSKAWLLGSSEGGVSVISEIDDKDIINSMLLEDSRKGMETGQGRISDFLSILRRLGAPTGVQTPSGADEIRKRRERLKGL